MNPDNVIRPWLLGCGQWFGAIEAHFYRWPDPSTRPEVPYFTYRPVSAVPDPSKHAAIGKHEISGSYDVASSYQQHWRCTYRIDLFNSPSGFIDLAGCAVAATQEQAYKNLFQKNNAAFKECGEVRDDTVEDGERIYYHQWMTVEFFTWVVYKHKNINHVVTSVVLDDIYGG